MCQSQVWLVRNNENIDHLHDVVSMEQHAEGVMVHFVLEESRLIKAASIMAVDLQMNTIRIKV